MLHAGYVWGLCVANELMQRVEQCYLLAEQHFSRSFHRPQISFALRGKAAGVAHIGRNLLRFNSLLYQQNRDDFLRQTVAHEVAHLLAHELYGRGIRPHGPQWQGIMQEVFGLPALRCHSYQLPATPQTMYRYRCDCREHDLGVRRHRSCGRGRHYLCRNCQQRLYFTGSVSTGMLR